MLSWLPHKEQDSCHESEVSGPDLTDKTFEINMINSSNLRKKDFALFSGPLGDDQPNREELTYHVMIRSLNRQKIKYCLTLKRKDKAVRYLLLC